ncbi:hypothetical protein L596_004091 [Steinernema carpocapsae]|uniref:Uncharacterized protein n=1 Tax=Steinernema carpocapsae TaxID=34508 RepID=A0A4U8UYS0_STECR|nr:hypothetical protein L596_004091 [Steinernema carpocapsae]
MSVCSDSCPQAVSSSCKCLRHRLTDGACEYRNSLKTMCTLSDGGRRGAGESTLSYKRRRAMYHRRQSTLKAARMSPVCAALIGLCLEWLSESEVARTRGVFCLFRLLSSYIQIEYSLVQIGPSCSVYVESFERLIFYS